MDIYDHINNTVESYCEDKKASKELVSFNEIKKELYEIRLQERNIGLKLYNQQRKILEKIGIGVDMMYEDRSQRSFVVTKILSDHKFNVSIEVYPLTKKGKVSKQNRQTFGFKEFIAIIANSKIIT